MGLDLILRWLGHAPRRTRPDPLDVPTWSRSGRRVDPVALRKAGCRSIPRLAVA